MQPETSLSFDEPEAKHLPLTRQALLPILQSTERVETVSTNLWKPLDSFEHVHVCVHCGGTSRREEFEDRAQTTGIYLCQKCGKEGPLNIQIRAADTL